MPSNREIIENAVEQVLNSDESIDLLLISNTLDNINGEVVGTDPDYGMNYNYLYIGMSGQRMVDQMNSNWRATDAQFLAHNRALSLRIISNQIKEIKVENNIAYYTTDELDPTSEEDTRTWHSLQTSWGQLTGNLTDQTDLRDALNDKVSYEVFNGLASQVGTNTNNIIILQGSLSTLSDTVAGIVEQISGNNGILARLGEAETLLAKKITSQQVKEIRVNNNALEYTINGTTWIPVSSAGVVEWGDIIGDINNQADLLNLFSNMQSEVDDLADTIEAHDTDTNNPHRVTKAQVGLGNVDNTADTDKPLSTPQRTAVQEMINDSGFRSLTQAQYEALTTINNNVIYFINDL